MKKFYLLFFLICVISSTQCIAGEVPFTIEKGYLIVPAKIQKNTSVEMIVSTGSLYSRIDGDLGIKLSLDFKMTMGSQTSVKLEDRITYGEVQTSDKSAEAVAYTELTGVSVGDAKPKTLTTKLTSMYAESKKIGRSIAGILGADFFEGKIVEFDFKRKVMKFLDQSPINSENVEAVGNSKIDNQSSYKMDLTVQTFYRVEKTLPVASNIIFNGKSLKALFDTGDGLSVSLSPNAAKQIGFSAVTHKKGFEITKLNSLKFYDFEVKNLSLVLFGKGAGFEKNLNDYGAIIGLSVLQNFILTLDFKEKIIILKR